MAHFCTWADSLQSLHCPSISTFNDNMHTLFSITKHNMYYLHHIKWWSACTWLKKTIKWILNHVQTTLQQTGRLQMQSFYAHINIKQLLTTKCCSVSSMILSLFFLIQYLTTCTTTMIGCLEKTRSRQDALSQHNLSSTPQAETAGCLLFFSP